MVDLISSIKTVNKDENINPLVMNTVIMK